jgi:hypothetical protein
MFIEIIQRTVKVPDLVMAKPNGVETIILSFLERNLLRKGKSLPGKVQCF